VIITTARFRRFDSLSQAFESHGKLLSTASPYRPAMELVKDPDQFADALTRASTQPIRNTATTLKWVMDNYQLSNTTLRLEFLGQREAAFAQLLFQHRMAVAGLPLLQSSSATEASTSTLAGPFWT